jgi:hypothetical protein
MKRLVILMALPLCLWNCGSSITTEESLQSNQETLRQFRAAAVDELLWDKVGFFDRMPAVLETF